jgi:lysine N6-hydroxylase
VGVGIGPSNLSLAALLEPLDGIDARFYGKDDEFRWHPGLLFPEATLQVPFLKDLVTLADPTNPYSFLCFLASEKRIYRFINANFPRVKRMEFDQYLRWVCKALSNLRFGQPVEAVGCYDGDALTVVAKSETVRTKNVILGSGLEPDVPKCARPHLGRTVFHAHGYLAQDVQLARRRVAVVGGGQTGAEVVCKLLADSASLPEEVCWISRRPNFLPIDESPFTEELFVPAYSDHFYGLPAAERKRLLSEQKLASDGVAPELLAQIYQRLYELEFLEGAGRTWRLCPGHELVGMDAERGHYSLALSSSTGLRRIDADVVVLCTGYKHCFPSYLEPLAGRLNWHEGGFAVREDFSVEWDGPEDLKIYAQNAARQARGVADPNLSLLAWRSAKIINSLLGRCVYDVDGAAGAIDWGLPTVCQAAGAPS